jgi:transketolase
MRNTFITELIRLAEIDPKIFLVVGDLGYSVVEPFINRFPDRFINAGIAEQNMMGLAAGMASEGYQVFVYSIANFPTFRCAEQIRNDVDYHKLPVTIVSVGGGLAYGALGYSHHAVQDYGLMRMFPNMLIAAPGDPNEVRACIRYIHKNPGPSYLRLGKVGEPEYNQSIPDLRLGEWNLIRKGVKGGDLLLTTGAALSEAIKRLSTEKYHEYSVYTLPLWGMNAKKIQCDQLKKWRHIETIEDHLYDCGFGSWVRESLEREPLLNAKLKVNALDSSVCGIVGAQEYLNNLGGICLSFESVSKE